MIRSDLTRWYGIFLQYNVLAPSSQQIAEQVLKIVSGYAICQSQQYLHVAAVDSGIRTNAKLPTTSVYLGIPSNRSKIGALTAPRRLPSLHVCQRAAAFDSSKRCRAILWCLALVSHW